MKQILKILLLGYLFILANTHTTYAEIFNPQVKTLDNGLKVVVISNHKSPIIKHTIWYGVGAMDEELGKSGIAHFLEHLLFKGTIKNPEYSKIIAANGGKDNAFTSWDYTSYYQTIAVDKLELVMRLEADRMRNIKLTTNDIDSEKLVVLEERRLRYENNPSDKLREETRATLYLNHPYGRPIIGWQAEIENLSYDDIRKFYNKYYHPNNAIVVISGDITPKYGFALAKKYYGVIKAEKLPTRVALIEPKHNTIKTVKLYDEKIQQPTIFARWLTNSSFYPKFNENNKKNNLTLDIISEMLGGATGLLYPKLVLNDKKAIMVNAFYRGDTRGPGEFTIYAIPSKTTTIDQLQKSIMDELKQLVKTGINQQQLDKFRNRMIDSAGFANDSVTSGANIFGQILINGGNIEMIENWVDNLNEITIKDINLMIKDIFGDKNPLISQSLPLITKIEEN